MSYIRSAIFVASILGAKYASAQTSLYIPGFDPQPLSANIIGVGSDGRTTWQIVPGQATGTDQQVDFIGTATLVEGPNDAVLSYNVPAASLSMVESCSISGSLAACVNVLAGSTTFTATETAAPFAVQGGGTLSGAPAPSAAPSGSGSLSATSSPHSSASTPSKTAPSQSGNAPAPTESPNAGFKTGFSHILVASVAALGAILM